MPKHRDAKNADYSIGVIDANTAKYSIIIRSLDHQCTIAVANKDTFFSDFIIRGGTNLKFWVKRKTKENQPGAGPPPFRNCRFARK